MIVTFFIKVFDKDSTVDILSKRLDYLMKVDTGISEQMKALETQKIPADVKCNVNHNKLLVKAEIADIQEHIIILNL